MENLRILERELWKLAGDTESTLRVRNMGLKLRCAAIDANHRSTQPFVKPDQVAKALGRTLWWLILLASRLGYTLDDLAKSLYEERFDEESPAD